MKLIEEHLQNVEPEQALSSQEPTGTLYAEWNLEPKIPPLSSGWRRYQTVMSAVWAGWISLVLVWLLLGPGPSPMSHWISNLFWLIPMTVPLHLWLSRRTSAEAVELVNFPPGEQDFASAVTVQVVQDGVVTGIDWGRMWVQDNALFFTGNRCSFIVAAKDITPRPGRGKWLEPYGVDEPKSFSVWISHPSRQLRIVATLAGNPGRETFREFGRQIGGLAEAKPDKRWTSVHPPLNLAKGIPSFRFEFGQIMTAAILLLILYSVWEGAPKDQDALLATPFLVWLIWRLQKSIRRTLIIRKLDSLSSQPPADQR